jgi:hypothetical protein
MAQVQDYKEFLDLSKSIISKNNHRISKIKTDLNNFDTSYVSQVSQVQRVEEPEEGEGEDSPTEYQERDHYREALE